MEDNVFFFRVEILHKYYVYSHVSLILQCGKASIDVSIGKELIYVACTIFLV